MEEEDEIKEFLEQHAKEIGRIVVDPLAVHMKGLGVTCLEDLRDIQRNNLVDTDLRGVERGRLLKCIDEHAPYRAVSAFDKATNGIREFLEYCEFPDEQLDDIESLLVNDVGVSSLEDLEFVGEDDLQNAGLTVVEQNRFLRYIQEQIKAPQGATADSARRGGRKKHNEPAKKSVKPTPAQDLIKIRYIYCNNLFGEETGQKLLEDLDPATHTMEDIKGMIAEDEEIETHQLTIELYSMEGYPLNVNYFTESCTLKQWMINNNDLLYVFLRKKEQPGVREYTSLPPVDHTLGVDELHVDSQLFGSFTLKASLHRDSAEDICRKVLDVTKVSTAYMQLYAREGFEPLDIYTELRDGDRITMVLKNPAAHIGSYTAEYGKKSYNMLQPQTDEGIAKFFAILRYLCLKKKETVNFQSLLSLVKRLTNCPPIVYALTVLYENSCLSLSCWVALIEGLYQFFRSWLAIFLERVEESEVFEFSDYLWAALMKSTERAGEACDGFDIEVEKMNLQCPISGVKIVDPVTLPACNEVFDRYSVVEKIEKGEQVEGCLKVPLVTADMGPAQLTSRLLMYNPWHSDREVCIWKIPLHALHNSVIPKGKWPCEWYELASCLDLLHINAPDGLFGLECLTFTENGHLALFMGFTKDKENSHSVYDPITCDYVKKDKKMMKRLAKDNRNQNIVSQDLTQLVPKKRTMKLSPEVLERARPKPIFTEDISKNVQWDPEEAVVVLLDISGSMSEVFSEGHEGLERIEAAKIFFGAFALRTQAYNFHHAIALILFDTIIEQRMSLTKISDLFEQNLEDVKTRNRTALHEAMAVAAEQLKLYAHTYPGCRRRILCLTDGYENESRRFQDPFEVTKYLKGHDVVVDTVLIDNCSANVQQKAISHATGGACFMPGTIVDGLKLFEMETFLSLRARAGRKFLPRLYCQGDFHQFENTSQFPFDTKKLPSNLITDQAFKTLSTRKALERCTKEAAPPSCVKRILKEIRDFQKAPMPSIDIFPSEESAKMWKILMKGPDYSPYSKGVFLLVVRFPDSYPSQPPEIRFHTPVYHCNINSYGRICHKVLSESYTPSLTMKDILGCVYGLLIWPEPEDPLDSVIGFELLSSLKKGTSIADKDCAYGRNAEQHTDQYALKKSDYQREKKKLGAEL